VLTLTRFGRRTVPLSVFGSERAEMDLERVSKCVSDPHRDPFELLPGEGGRQLPRRNPSGEIKV